MPLQSKRGIKNQDKYGLEKCPKLPEGELWGIRPELQLYDYAELVLKIVNVEKKISYDQIKSILASYNFPVDCGQVLYGLDGLKEKIIVRRSKPSYIIILKE